LGSTTMKRDRIALCLLTIGSTITCMAQVEVGILPSTVWCAGTPFDVPIIASGTFDPGNTFVVELSDPGGVFAPATAIGSLVSGVSGTVSGADWGSLVPGAGYLVRVRSTSPASISAPYATSLTLAAPIAGTDAFLTLCTSGTPTDLFPLLPGATPGGTWDDPNATGGLSGSVLSPALLGPGTYTFTYTVNEAGCTDEATVTVAVNAVPNAGTNAMITVCSTDPPFTMYQELGGTPNAGGAWTAPNGAVVSGVFDPSVDPPGFYAYTVAGDPPCLNEASTLMIAVTQAPNAGTDGSATYCPTDVPFTLIGQLSGSPSPGGTWTFGGNAHGPTFIPGVDVPGAYVYTVPGIAPCGNTSATVTAMLGICIITTPVNMGFQSVTE